MLPPFYQDHLKSQLRPAQYLLLTLLVQLLQTIKQTKLETLAASLALPIFLRVVVVKFNDFYLYQLYRLKRYGFHSLFSG